MLAGDNGAVAVGEVSAGVESGIGADIEFFVIRDIGQPVTAVLEIAGQAFKHIGGSAVVICTATNTLMIAAQPYRGNGITGGVLLYAQIGAPFIFGIDLQYRLDVGWNA